MWGGQERIMRILDLRRIKTSEFLFIAKSAITEKCDWKSWREIERKNKQTGKQTEKNEIKNKWKRERERNNYKLIQINKQKGSER